MDAPGGCRWPWGYGRAFGFFPADSEKSLDQNIPPPREISPNLRKAWLDIHLVGLRNLIKKGYGSIRNPYIQFNLVSTGYGDSVKTPSSRLPTPNDPNFLERKIMQVNIPDDPLYCPALEVQVWDSRTLDSTLLGVITIDLRTKLPWNGNEYVPPRQHQILSDAQEAKERPWKHVIRIKRPRLMPPNARRAAAVEAMEKGSSKKGDTKNPLLNMRGDGLHGSDEEEEEDEEMFVLPDEGHGVFPPEAGAKELGTQYEKLPPIFDADEEEEAKREKDGGLHEGERIRYAWAGWGTTRR